ncbi:hypothetical protein CQ13_07750 [Bradyrhizobium retamae]|uniref:Uncharacterized protein n=1 Tax=Bradyrhizobium retamae TaxID=1300035 RepID=A0A0R3MPR8_9BRAD|nr:hypothetical protein CQ13_07750 [Bradyrhizobium retamae]
MGDFFWDVATSFPALGLNGLLLLVAGVVGWFPLLKYLPGIGSYVPAARLVAVMVALLICFLVGFRVADEREEAKNLRATLAAREADLENSRKARADDALRSAAIERGADARSKSDAEYISALEASSACPFDPGDARGGRPGGLRPFSAGGASRSLAPAPAGAR